VGLSVGCRRLGSSDAGGLSDCRDIEKATRRFGSAR
jgi:hypothetical protein